MFRPAVSFLGLGILILLFSFGLYFKSQHLQDTAIVISDVETKFEPRPEATTHYKLFEGSKVKVVKSEAGWIKVKRLDGKLGWCPQETVERVDLEKKS